MPQENVSSNIQTAVKSNITTQTLTSKVRTSYRTNLVDPEKI